MGVAVFLAIVLLVLLVLLALIWKTLGGLRRLSLYLWHKLTQANVGEGR